MELKEGFCGGGWGKLCNASKILDWISSLRLKVNKGNSDYS